MSAKSFEIDSIGKITVYKRRNNRRINLSVAQNGSVRVSIPSWMPYKAGLNFARSKENWIASKRPTQPKIIDEHTLVLGHQICFQSIVNITKPKLSIKDSSITITHPSNLAISHPEVQTVAYKGALKVLRLNAESTLKKRIDYLSKQLDIPYKSLKIKQLSRRWGSCDREKNIVLNLYLVQLPDELIEYVICHELTHTMVLNHGADFWQALKQISPQSLTLKSKLKQYSPSIVFWFR